MRYHDARVTGQIPTDLKVNNRIHARTNSQHNRQRTIKSQIQADVRKSP